VRYLWWSLLAVLLLTALGAAYVYLQLRALDVERLTDDLYVLRGLGGNSAVLRTEAGAVVVDTMTLPLQGARIRARARELTGQDVLVVINTHYHLDHTHGNPAFDPGTRVLATQRTREHLEALDADFWTGEAAELLPTDTFDDRMTLRLGNKTLELLHPGRGHTDGDLVVRFVEDRAVHLGDLLFQGHYPNIDLEAGGSVEAWPATLERVLALEFDRVIPGHGPSTDRDGIRRFQAFMAELWRIGSAAAAAGDSLETTLATGSLTEDAGFEPIRFIVPIGLDRKFVLRRAWEEATGQFERRN